MSLDPFYELEDGAGALTGPQPIVVAANGAHKPNGGEPRPNGGEPKPSDVQAH
jgi:hypothetical protein